MAKDILLLPAIAFAAGIVLSPVLPASTAHLGIAFAVSAAAVVLSRHRRWHFLAVSLFAGMLCECMHRPGLAPELDAASGDIVTLAGCVTEPPSLSEGKEQFVLDLEPGARVRVSKFLRDGEPPPSLSYGQRIEVEGKIRTPHNFGNPGAFDYAAYLARRDVYWTATMTSNSTAKVLDGACGSPAMAWIYGLRTRLLQRIEQSYPAQPYTVAILQALLVGESARFERVWADQFRRTGTYHAIVISGLHVTVIAAAVLTLLGVLPFDRNGMRLAAALLIWIYAGMCGWQAPVVRAAGGFTLYALGRLYYRECRLLNLLAALAFLFLALDPSQLIEASFQLTFLSVLALGALVSPAINATTAPLRYGLRDLADTAKDVHVQPRVAQFRIEMRLLAETLTFWLPFPPVAWLFLIRAILWPLFWIWESVLLSAVMQVGLALPMVVYFHRLSFSGLSANLIVTPLLTLVVPLALVALLTGWDWLLQVTGFLVGISQTVTAWHASWEPNWRVPDPPIWLSAGFVLSLAALAVFRRRVLVVPALVLLAIIAWHPFEPHGTGGEFELTMIDVGQGDSLLIGFPDGRWMLVDGGGIPVFGNRPPSRLEIGEDVVSSYLFTRAIHRVDIVVSTHQHEDHAAGLAAVIDNFHPKELWAGASPDSPIWRRLRDRVGTVRNLHNGDSMEYSGVRIDVLAPPIDYQPRPTPSNNDSLVLRFTYGRHKFLLTGDAERTIEQGMLEQLGKVNVLKVAHHGSKTSTEDSFLDAVEPTYALISAGKDNIFRHPHPDVVRRLQQRHATIFRSDEWGLVTIRSNGIRFTVDTNRWNPR